MYFCRGPHAFWRLAGHIFNDYLCKKLPLRAFGLSVYLYYLGVSTKFAIFAVGFLNLCKEPSPFTLSEKSKDPIYSN